MNHVMNPFMKRKEICQSDLKCSSRIRYLRSLHKANDQKKFESNIQNFGNEEGCLFQPYEQVYNYLGGEINIHKYSLRLNASDHKKKEGKERKEGKLNYNIRIKVPSQSSASHLNEPTQNLELTTQFVHPILKDGLLIKRNILGSITNHNDISKKQLSKDYAMSKTEETASSSLHSPYTNITRNKITKELARYTQRAALQKLKLQFTKEVEQNQCETLSEYTIKLIKHNPKLGSKVNAHKSLRKDGSMEKLMNKLFDISKEAPEHKVQS